MQIHELPSTDISNTDKIAFDTGENTYSGQFVNIANKVLEKLPNITFSGLTTTATNVIDAINELVTSLSNSSLTTQISALTFSALSTTAKTLTGAINELYASLVARTNVTVTVGNGTVMTLGTNTSHIKGSEMYINCSISFSGSRSSGTMLARMSTTVPSTQYLTVYKNGSAAYLTNISAGTGDISCPVAFASGDIAYIVGVVSTN